MDKYSGKVAVVTGASSGIGAAVVENLVKHGMIVVGLARREDRLQELANKCSEYEEGKFHYIKADVRKEEDILQAFAWIEENVGGVTVMVNNAGIIAFETLPASTTDVIKNVWETNVIGLTICSREAAKSMMAHGIDNEGYIINISSVAGTQSTPFPTSVMYAASKRAVRTISEGHRNEFNVGKSKIRVTSINPGFVETELFDVAGCPMSSELPMMTSEDIASCVVFCLQMPLTCQVTDLTIMPAGDDMYSFFYGQKK